MRRTLVEGDQDHAVIWHLYRDNQLGRGGGPAGWHFVEENVQGLFQGLVPREEYTGEQRIAASALPVYAANGLVPANLKITGPSVDCAALHQYMSTVLGSGAGDARCFRLVFGSGGARQVPPGWGRGEALEQIIEFSRMAARLAARHGVTLVLEHLNRDECNIVNTLEEELLIIKQVNHPNFQGLLDTYHFWKDGLGLTSVDALLPYIQHVHVADLHDRVAPGESGKSDYRPTVCHVEGGRLQRRRERGGRWLRRRQGRPPRAVIPQRAVE